MLRYAPSCRYVAVRGGSLRCACGKWGESPSQLRAVRRVLQLLLASARRHCSGPVVGSVRYSGLPCSAHPHMLLCRSCVRGAPRMCVRLRISFPSLGTEVNIRWGPLSSSSGCVFRRRPAASHQKFRKSPGSLCGGCVATAPQGRLIPETPRHIECHRFARIALGAMPASTPMVGSALAA